MSNTRTCASCGSKTATLRRGRCELCYFRWIEARPVGVHAQCTVCHDRRHDYLRSFEFHERFVVMCHGCVGLVGRMKPLPATMEAVRQEVSRDRRWGDRRCGLEDKRVYCTERRRLERRRPRVKKTASWLDASEFVVQVIDEGSDEYTQIIDAVRAGRSEFTGPHIPLRLESAPNSE